MKPLFIALVGITICWPAVFAAVGQTGAAPDMPSTAPSLAPAGPPSKSPAKLAFLNTNQTYNGKAREVTCITEPAGLKAALTYDGNPWPPTNAGNYTVIGALDNANYCATNTTTLTISKAPLAVRLAPPVSKVYDGNTEARLGPANYTCAGLMRGETCIVNQTAGAYADKNVGAGIMVTVLLASTNFADYGDSGFLTNNYLLPDCATGAVGSITRKKLN